LHQAGLEIFDVGILSIRQYSANEPGFLLVKGAPNQPGIRVMDGAELNIYSGIVTAQSSVGSPYEDGAAIGGQFFEKCGKFNIYGEL